MDKEYVHKQGADIGESSNVEGVHYKKEQEELEENLLLENGDIGRCTFEDLKREYCAFNYSFLFFLN